MTEYVGHAFSVQHRTVLFFFLINGTRARVTRWDRSGTILTESFDYTEDRVTLRDILWGLSLLTSSARGSDDTAIPLSPTSSDYRKMTKEAQECATDISEAEGTVVESQGPHTFKHVRDLFAASIADGAPRYRIYVLTSSGGMRAYLVGKPIIAAPGMSGRGTRGFVAWDKTAEHFVFLKDAWRPFYENIEMEGAVLRKLAAAKVRNVPTYVCDAELDHHTSTPSLAKKSAERKPAEEPPSATDADLVRPKTPQRRTSKRTRNGELISSLTPSQNACVNRGKCYFRHYRLVVEEVCLSLSVFKNGKQLFSVVRDCVQAHEDAVNKAHVHHRDISAGNMVICPTIVKCEDGKQRVTWRGVLIDWELSKPITPDDKQLAARQPKRIGTWQFTCARLLDDPSAAVMTADELESIFWVILYNALRYLRHTCLNVTSAMFDLFDDYDYGDTLAEYRCGPGRRSAISTARLPKVCGEKYKFLDDDLKDRHPANNFVRTVLRWLRARYAQLEGESQSEADEDDYISVDPHKRAANAQKLENHKALLNLFDDLLQREWPTDDKCGDLLKDPSKAHVPQMPLNKPLVPLTSAHLKEDVGDNGKPERKRVCTRAKTRRRSQMTAVPEEDEESELPQVEDLEPRPMPAPTRTRGRRTTRLGRGSGSTYNRKSSLRPP
ncbi:hypothetical protein C8Q74DRAFT_1320854 [Fomes fomentarius]|nr:hypothetical protein C8Q74DRAFT_1320854 [Fomes fomentarius]